MGVSESGNTRKKTAAEATRKLSLEAALCLKLAALQRMARLVGPLPITGRRDEAERKSATLRERLPLLAVQSILVLLDADAHPINHAAAGTLLEFFFPGWRESAHPHLVGRVVDRDSNEVRQWRRRVLDRDGHACQECGETENLEAHHIVRWVDAPHLRVQTENGRTLCGGCHRMEHAAA